MQAFTDLVGTTAVPAHAFLSELTELTPTLDIAMAAHDTADQASASPWTLSPPMTLCSRPAAETTN